MNIDSRFKKLNFSVPDDDDDRGRSRTKRRTSNSEPPYSEKMIDLTEDSKIKDDENVDLSEEKVHIGALAELFHRISFGTDASLYENVAESSSPSTTSVPLSYFTKGAMTPSSARRGRKPRCHRKVRKHQENAVAPDEDKSAVDAFVKSFENISLSLPTVDMQFKDEKKKSSKRRIPKQPKTDVISPEFKNKLREKMKEFHESKRKINTDENAEVEEKEGENENPAEISPEFLRERKRNLLRKRQHRLKKAFVQDMTNHSVSPNICVEKEENPLLATFEKESLAKFDVSQLFHDAQFYSVFMLGYLFEHKGSEFYSSVIALGVVGETHLNETSEDYELQLRMKRCLSLRQKILRNIELFFEAESSKQSSYFLEKMEVVLKEMKTLEEKSLEIELWTGFQYVLKVVTARICEADQDLIDQMMKTVALCFELWMQTFPKDMCSMFYSLDICKASVCSHFKTISRFLSCIVSTGFLDDAFLVTSKLAKFAETNFLLQSILSNLHHHVRGSDVKSSVEMLLVELELETERKPNLPNDGDMAEIVAILNTYAKDLRQILMLNAELKSIIERKNAAKAAFSNQKFDVAKQIYSELLASDAMKLDSKYKKFKSILYSNLAACCFNLGSFLSAIEFCELSIQQDEANMKAAIRKARSFVKLERFEEAIQVLKAFYDKHKKQSSILNEIRSIAREKDVFLFKKKEEARTSASSYKPAPVSSAAATPSVITSLEVDEVIATNDYYRIFMVTKSASSAEIKKSYHKLALKYHPDKSNTIDETLRGKYEEAFKKINSAFEILTDSAAKRKYDMEQVYSSPPASSSSGSYSSYRSYRRYASGAAFGKTTYYGQHSSSFGSNPGDSSSSRYSKHYSYSGY